MWKLGLNFNVLLKKKILPNHPSPSHQNKNLVSLNSTIERGHGWSCRQFHYQTHQEDKQNIHSGLQYGLLRWSFLKSFLKRERKGSKQVINEANNKQSLQSNISDVCVYKEPHPETLTELNRLSGSLCKLLSVVNIFMAVVLAHINKAFPTVPINPRARQRQGCSYLPPILPP